MSPTSKAMVALSALYNQKGLSTRISQPGIGVPPGATPDPAWGPRRLWKKKSGTNKKQERWVAHEEGPSVQLKAASDKGPSNV